MNNKNLAMTILGLAFVLLTGTLGGLVVGSTFGYLIGFPKLFGFSQGVPAASVFFSCIAFVATAWYIKLNWDVKAAKKRKKAKQRKRKLAKKAKERAVQEQAAEQQS